MGGREKGGRAGVRGCGSIFRVEKGGHSLFCGERAAKFEGRLYEGLVAKKMGAGADVGLVRAAMVVVVRQSLKRCWAVSGHSSGGGREARPKSMSLSGESLCLVTYMKFSGLRSRCTMPAACRHLTAETI